VSAQEVLIADAIAAELNDSGRPWFPLPSAAVRTWSPWYAAEDGDLDALKVSVLATAQKVPGDPVDREGTRLFDYEVWIDFQRKVPLASGQVDDATVDGLCLICQQVQDWFNDLTASAHELSGATGWHVVKAERPLIFNPDELYSNHVFVSSIGLTVRGFR
jgi:hypothetical protein